MQEGRDIKQIKRMIFGIAIMIYSMVVSAGDFITNIGLIVVLSGVFYDWFNNMGKKLVELLSSSNTTIN
ncbi:hypothetical protein EZV73_01840 [Acidaminobacter sp. JC074]|uniref:hypothetical protein n=1 Tax=Acidaminobacter sp. JC074 TaxID=2530199 RepID=UPI001F0E8487|nr:hypothetical protein [Acidaminobacter sp. JC074]MCH4886287.1 hypothetical protein [Acidaminobacter sp. JC074]